jgi:hypothetical protein
MFGNRSAVPLAQLASVQLGVALLAFIKPLQRQAQCLK